MFCMGGVQGFGNFKRNTIECSIPNENILKQSLSSINPIILLINLCSSPAFKFMVFLHWPCHSAQPTVIFCLDYTDTN